MNIDIIRREDARILAVRHVGPYPEIGAAFARLSKLVRRLELDPTTGEWLGAFHDDPQQVSAEQLRSDAGITISGPEPDPESLDEGARVVTLPGGRFAVTTHAGSYSGLPGTWAKLMSEGLPAAGLKPRAGLCFEIYRNDPDHTPEADLVTELYEPIED